MTAVAQKIKQSLRYSILDGSFYSVMVGFGETFLVPFAIFLKASNLEIGILGSLPQTVGYFSQLFAEKMVRWFGSRKKMVCLFALLQGLIYLPASLVFYCGQHQILALILLTILYWILGMLPVPAWNSWMGDLVAESKRGIYFGRRNNILGLVNFMAFLAAGYLLQHLALDQKSQQFGFAVLFLIAFGARMISVFWLTLKYDPPYVTKNRASSRVLAFVGELKNRNFQLYVGYQCFMNFALYLAAPFFAAYMLKDLHFDYKTFTLVTAAAILAKQLTMPIWGRLSDKYGTRKILELSGFLIPINSLLWVFSANFWWLLAAQIYAGVAWAGFELSSFIFIYDITAPEKRTVRVAGNNALNGLAMLSGSLLGGVIVRYNNFFSSKYLLVFLVSFFLRYLASLIFVPRLEEVRSVQNISAKNLILEFFTSMTNTGLVYNLMTFARKKKKIT